MSVLPYKLRTDAWWLDGEIIWRKQPGGCRANGSLDRMEGSVICDRNTQTKAADENGTSHPDRR